MMENIENKSREEIIDLLLESGIKLTGESRANGCCDKLLFSNGCIINCFDKGTRSFQGRNIEQTKVALGYNVPGETDIPNRKVFVVYGHDTASRDQLENILMKMGLEPVILDQLVSSGETVIEKLERHIGEVQFGIVLATPDDKGCRAGKESELRYRVRQNVVFEMGMLLNKLGRSHVAVLLKDVEDFEKPSDIAGLIYMPYKNHVKEVSVKLAQELNKLHYNIDIAAIPT